MPVDEKKLSASFCSLLDYAIENELISQEDRIYCHNLLLDALSLEEIEESTERIAFPDCLYNLCTYACENGIIEDSISRRDLFDTKLMGLLTPRPSQVVSRFRELYAASPEKATDYFYKLSQDCNYIRRDRIKKDEHWTTETEYGELEISINLSKPEKDPRDIAAAKLRKASGYPKCLLCIENEGFSGTLSHPARQNLRIIPIDICGEQWGLQYSPYVYYNEHCIVMNSKHVPMVIDEAVFSKLFAFVEKFPEYFLGSNADLPIVGGSILSHEHFQGGRHELPMAKAKKDFDFYIPGFEDVNCCVLHYPMTALRLNGKDRERICALAGIILKAWRGYTDESAFIFSATDGERHNTVTPIVAESYSLSEDGLTITIPMKQGYTWEDGTPLTANDYVYSARRFVDPATNAQLGHPELEFVVNGYEIWNKGTETDVTKLGVTAPDDYTIEIQLNKPCAYFMNLFAIGSWMLPIKQSVVESAGTDYAANLDNFMACGPYKAVTYTHDAEFVIEKREDHFEADKYDVDRITRAIVSDVGTAVNMFETGDLDCIFDIDSSYIPDYEDEITFVTGASLHHLMCNFGKEGALGDLLRNDNFRMALSYAINRKGIVAAVNGNDGTTPWSRLVGPHIPGNSGMYVEEYPYETAPLEGNAEKAKEFLAAALTDLGYTDVSQLPAVELALLEGTSYKGYAEAFVDQWNQVLGLTNISIGQYPFMTVAGLLMDFSFDIVYWFPSNKTDASICLDIPVSENSYGHYTSWKNYPLNREIAQRLKDAAYITDNKARLDELFELEQIITPACPCIPLWLEGSNYIAKDYVSGISYGSTVMTFENLKVEEHA